MTATEMPATGMGHGAAPSAKETAAEVAGEAIQQTKAVAGEAKQHVASLVDQTKSDLQQQTHQRVQQASSSLRTLSGQLRSLREGKPQEAGPLHHYLIDAEQRVSSWAHRLETGGPELVLRDVRAFARRKPGAFLAAAIGAGFVAGRLARAGASAAHDQSTSGTDTRDQFASVGGGQRPGLSGSDADGSRVIMADAPLASGTFA